MTVYIDIVLIENIFMNYIILFAVSIISKAEIRIARIFIASLIGGIYAIISYITDLEIYKTLVLKFLLSIAMVYTAFFPKTIKKCCKQLLIFYLTSFTFGGTAFALLYFINPKQILMQNGIYIGSYPIKVAVLGGIIGCVIITISFKIVKGKISSKNMYCKIKVKILEKEVESLAMIDTGNLLKEPITKTPVVVMELELLKEVIPESILEHLKEIINGNGDYIPQSFINKIRLIPFSSLGMPNGMLIGIKADEIIVNYDEEEYKHNNIIVGLYDKKLSKKGMYTSLIGISLIEGRKMYEHTRFVKV
ncbi:MAG: sigma-E processing peptidase SpoIIGA [Clostridia bacterium]|nr:sigma-E processing peptidase SpoIIGA [Clostridia bacterium]